MLEIKNILILDRICQICIKRLQVKLKLRKINNK